MSLQLTNMHAAWLAFEAGMHATIGAEAWERVAHVVQASFYYGGAAAVALQAPEDAKRRQCVAGYADAIGRPEGHAAAVIELLQKGLKCQA